MVSKGVEYLFAVSGCLTESLASFLLPSFLKETIQNKYSVVAKDISQKALRVSTTFVTILPNKLIYNIDSQRIDSNDVIYYHTVILQN